MSLASLLVAFRLTLADSTVRISSLSVEFIMHFLLGMFATWSHWGWTYKPQVPRVEEIDVDFTLMASPASTLEVHSCPKSSSSRPPYLPNEIVLSILEHTHEHDTQRPDKVFLRDASLVSKDWSLISQKILFRDVSLKDESGYQSFLRATDNTTPRSAMLRDAVQSLHFTIDHNHPSGLSQYQFAHAVTLCPNLRSISISLYGHSRSRTLDLASLWSAEKAQRKGAVFDDFTINTLRSGPKIDYLRLTNWSNSSITLVQLLEVWPSLKHLSITGTPPVLPSSAPEFSPCSLEEFRMNCQTAPSVDFLKWLLSNSKDSLRILQFDRNPPSNVLDYFTCEHRLALESLTIPSTNSTSGITLCTELKELKVESCKDALDICRPFVMSLEHLALGVHDDVSIPSVIRTIKRCSVIKTLTLHLWEGTGKHPHVLGNVRIACATRGIQLNVTKDIAQFRSAKSQILTR